MDVCCPRCGAPAASEGEESTRLSLGRSAPRLRHQPGATPPHWHCDRCGPVVALHVARGISLGAVVAVVAAIRPVRAPASAGASVPLWCPWPLLPGWEITGVAWAGDAGSGSRATALALTGPAPLSGGPADAVFVAEDLGVGLGNGLAGIKGTDPGAALRAAIRLGPAHAKVRAAGRPTPLWAVSCGPGRTVHVGEARGVWLFVITWPAEAGYLLAEEIQLQDLADSIPGELLFGPPSDRLRPAPAPD